MLGPKWMFLSCACRSSKCSLRVKDLIGCQCIHHATTIILCLQIIDMFIAYYNNCSFCWSLMCSLCTINNCSYYWLLTHSLRHATTLVLLLTNWVSSQKMWIWLKFTPFQRITTSFSIVPLVLVTHLYFFFVLARIFLSCTHIICF